jgi:hypothetical protein
MRQVLNLKRDDVKFIECTACNIKRVEAIHTLLFEDLVIIFGKMVQRLVEPGASFFGDFGSGFYGDVVLLGKVADGGGDRSAPVKLCKSVTDRFVEKVETYSIVKTPPTPPLRSSCVQM